MDGVFLSPSEDEFVGRIAEELEHFMVQGQHHRVLLFPPLSSRLRYLIHRTVENMELLSSFSVGEGWRRRTVICHSAVRLPNETSSDQKPGTNPPRSQRPAQPWGWGGRGARLRHPGDTHGDNSRASVGSGRITRPPRRKPDKALFVPKGIRKKANWRERESPGAEPDGDAAPGGENCPRNSIRDTQQELGTGGDGPGEQQEPGDAPGKGSAEHPLCDEEVPSLGNSSESCEQGSRDKDCSHSPSSAHNKHPPEAGEQESSHANSAVPEGSEFQGQLQEEKQSSRDSGGSEGGKNSIPLENRGGSRTDLTMRDQPVTAPAVTDVPMAAPAVTDVPVAAPAVTDVPVAAPAVTDVPMTAPAVADLAMTAPAVTDVPVTAPAVTDVPVTAPAVTDVPMAAPAVTDVPGTAPAVTDVPVAAPAVTDVPVAAPAVTAPAVAESLLLETQSLESSRTQSPPGEQDSRNAERGRGDLDEQETPSAGQVEQKPLQKVLEGPGEALAAPELLRGGDPGRKVPGEEEEDKERSDVAEALWRGQDLAAGDGGGTRQSGLEDDCTAELLAEIVGNLTVKDISVERISVDYSSYGEAPVSEGDLGHVTEIYDFPSSLKTEDLMEIFSDFHEGGFKIQWVDDTHALGIFSSLSSASQALGRRYPCLKLRPLLHASRQSRLRALQRPKLLQLGKERPQTDTAVARRLVSHALGWRHRQQEATGTEVFQPESLDQEE
ncbi:R3H and coiled-coil domain-containing protein 1 [Anomalospiza imberbis]|uniref:R3H and coiled-coil domain-containing protein 1 n=1 Tax=Anomalospiza imberbis TaxID=187417 RepID=UPI00358FE918